MLDAGKFIGGYTALQLAFMRLLPGKEFKGPVSPAGHVPVYTENGLAAVLGTFLTYALCVHAGVFPMGYIYQILGPFLAMMSVCSFFFCLMLYIKGRVAPSGYVCMYACACLPSADKRRRRRDVHAWYMSTHCDKHNPPCHFIRH